MIFICGQDCERLALESSPESHFGGASGQVIGLRIIFARDVRNAECQRLRQFAANPIQGVKLPAPASVLAAHLLHYNLGVREHMERFGSQAQGALQGFEERGVFGHVVVLVADPFLNFYSAAFAAVNNYANSGRPGIPQRSAIYISD